MKILIYGTPIHGFEFVGPFDDDDAARTWATECGVQKWWTVEPEDPGRLARLREAPLCRDRGCAIDEHPEDHGDDCPARSWMNWSSL